MTFNFFADCRTKEEVRKEFFRLCLKLHPDKGGDHNVFVRMQAEYQSAIAYFPHADDAKKTTDASEISLSEMIERLCRIRGITLELCGCWIWVTGDTYNAREILREWGLKFSGQKRAWYWFDGIDDERRRGSKKSLSQIRQIWGSERIETIGNETQLTSV